MCRHRNESSGRTWRHCYVGVWDDRCTASDRRYSEQGPSAEALLEAGAFAVVSADCSADDLRAKIERALDYDQKSRETRLRAKNSQIASKRLTQRQASIVRKLLEGMGNKGIAFDLGLSTRTIEIERAAILKLFGVGNAIELAHHVGQYEGMACCAARYVKPSKTQQHESTLG